MSTYYKNTYCREINDGEYTLIIAHDFGNHLKLHNSIWNNIQFYIENSTEIDIRFKDIVQVLINNGILFDRSKNSFDYRSISLQLTDACNLNCLHCCAKMIHSSGMISMEIIDKAIKLNPQILVLTGGEPMMHPKFWDIAKYVRKRFHNELRLMTNATLITEQTINDLCNCFDYIEISLDGSNAEETSRIRGKGIYDNSISAIKLLKKHGQKVTISAVADCFSDDFTDRFDKLADSLGVRAVSRDMGLVDEVVKNFDQIVLGGKEQYIKAKVSKLQENTQNSNDYRKCPMVRHSLFFDVNGNAYPCGGLVKEKFCIGNVNDLSNLPDYNDLEQMLLKEDKYKQCSECIYRAGCWGCLNEIENRSKIPEVFSAFCQHQKTKWMNILKEI